MGCPCSRNHHLQRNFQLQQQDARRVKRGVKLLETSGVMGPVRAGHHHNRILGRGIDLNQGHTRRRGAIDHNIGNIDAIGTELIA